MGEKIVSIRRDEKVHEIPVDKELYERLETRYGANTFRELLDDLADPANRFRALAKKYHRSTERIRKIYRQILAPYLEANGRLRFRTYAIRRPHFHDTPQDLLRIATRAEEKGHKVEYVNRISEKDGSVETCVSFVIINGCVCKIHSLINSHAQKARNQKYSKTSIRLSSLTQAQYQIFFVHPEGFSENFYIVPSEILRPRAQHEHANVGIYIPLLATPQRNPFHKIPWEQYRDAWHLIKKEDEPQLAEA